MAYGQGVTGYQQMLLVMERFGTYTSLLTRRRTFAAVKPTTRSRMDLVLRLDGAEPGGRLLDGRNRAGGGLNAEWRCRR